MADCRSINKRTLYVVIVILIISIAGFSVMTKSYPWEFLYEKENAPLFNQRKASAEDRHNNIKVDGLYLSTKDDELFSAGKPIEVRCRVTQHFIEGEKKPYIVVMKDGYEEFLREEITSENTEILFSATYTPKEPGIFPVACRADYNGAIPEDNERDNRLVKFVMVF